MNNYHIYGIGNALVDIEVEVTEQELEQLSIEKGVMTLVDEDRQNLLLKELTGEHHKRACGGSAANTVIGAAKLGAECFYSCKIADDEMGQFYASDLHQEGVISNLNQMSHEPGHTGRCIVMVTPDADRTMNTHLGITGDISYQQIDEVALAQSQWLYIEGYLVSSEPAKQAAIQAKGFAEKSGVKTAFSLSDPNMVKFFGGGLTEMIGKGVDLLFCNRDEAVEFTSTKDLDEACDKLQSIAKSFVITLGSEGALIVNNGEKISVAAQPVAPVDTNGAGDLFAGAFLYAITHGYSFEQAGKLASFASGTLVTQFGPRLTDDGMAKVVEYLKTIN
ncbi:MAG: adenosine kinase [Kangiellaceae bacterium]|nr:adenosine kinase [Kangiellaceae bacterium]